MDEINDYNNISETDDRREIIKQKLRQYYDGRIVRKDLTKSIREGANVPVYVLEYLLGQYCNSDDQEIIDEGVDNVKRILRDNYVRPDEAQKILSLLRERGSYTVIDRITVVLNTKEDRYEATFSKKIGGMEFYDVNFSYIDNDSFDEHFVSVPEQGGGKMIPEGMGKPGCLYTVSKSKTGMIGCYRLETQMMPGNGKLTCTGIGSGKEPKEATNTAFNYLKANGNAISGNISTTTKDYIINYQDMQGLGMTGNLALPTLIAISSAALSKPPISSLAVLGEISIGGTLIKVEDLASTLQVCLDSGAKKVLLPITSAADLGTVPSDLVGAFSLIFYSSPEEAVYKALGVE